jgi:hypothetical protein
LPSIKIVLFQEKVPAAGFSRRIKKGVNGVSLQHAKIRLTIMTLFSKERIIKWEDVTEKNISFWWSKIFHDFSMNRLSLAFHECIDKVTTQVLFWSFSMIVPFFLKMTFNYNLIVISFCTDIWVTFWGDQI